MSNQGYVLVLISFQKRTVMRIIKMKRIYKLLRFLSFNELDDLYILIKRQYGVE